ncbi:MAG: hypothetical protein ABII64_08815 [Elusimicrobiota bacterium]
MIYGIPIFGSIGKKSERRNSPRQDTNVGVQFQFITPLPLIVTKMFNISDSGAGNLKNVSSGGAMLEIPVNIKGPSFLYHLNKALETCQEAVGMDKPVILRPSDFSTVKLVFSSQNSADISVLAIPVWVRYFEKGSFEGTVNIGLRFPENMKLVLSGDQMNIETVFDS